MCVPRLVKFCKLKSGVPDFAEDLSDVEQNCRTVKFVFKRVGNGVSQVMDSVNSGMFITESKLGMRDNSFYH